MQGVEVATVPPVEGTHVLVLPLARRLEILGTQQVLAGSGRLQDHPRIRKPCHGEMSGRISILAWPCVI